VDGLVGQSGSAAEHGRAGDPGAEQPGSAQEAAATQLSGAQLRVGNAEIQGGVLAGAVLVAVAVLMAVVLMVVRHPPVLLEFDERARRAALVPEPTEGRPRGGETSVNGA
jgi:hypothetical protein